MEVRGCNFKLLNLQCTELDRTQYRDSSESIQVIEAVVLMHLSKRGHTSSWNSRGKLAAHNVIVPESTYHPLFHNRLGS